MGWSCTCDADKTLRKIEDACKVTRPPGVPTSNVFHVGGKRYFYEVTRRDQKDGGISGTLNLTWDDEQGSWARRVGTFRIDGRGRVVRGPALFRMASP